MDVEISIQTSSKKMRWLPVILPWGRMTGKIRLP
jgi:hypothetical protein